jgi:hypothetical protein
MRSDLGHGLTDVTPTLWRKNEGKTWLMDDINATRQHIAIGADDPVVKHGTIKDDRHWFRKLRIRIAKWSAWFGHLLGPGEVDDLTERQLRDLGIRRVVHRERWLDGLETRLPREHEYRFPLDD